MGEGEVSFASLFQWTGANANFYAFQVRGFFRKFCSSLRIIRFIAKDFFNGMTRVRIKKVIIPIKRMVSPGGKSWSFSAVNVRALLRVEDTTNYLVYREIFNNKMLSCALRMCFPWDNDSKQRSKYVQKHFMNNKHPF